MNADTLKQPESLVALRLRVGIAYRPHQLAKLRGQKTGPWLEFISWPWEQNGATFINARLVDQPDTVKTYECSRQVVPLRYSHWRQKAYREGWAAGIQYVLDEQKRYRQERAAADADKGAA